MRLTLLALLLGSAIALGARTPGIVSADSFTFTGSCSNASGTFPAALTVHSNSDRTLQVTNTATGSSVGVLIPGTVYLNGQLDFTVAPFDKTPLAGIQTTCTFAAPPGTFEVTGLLAPAS